MYRLSLILPVTQDKVHPFLGFCILFLRGIPFFLSDSWNETCVKFLFFALFAMIAMNGQQSIPALLKGLLPPYMGSFGGFSEWPWTSMILTNRREFIISHFLNSVHVRKCPYVWWIWTFFWYKFYTQFFYSQGWYEAPQDPGGSGFSGYSKSWIWLRNTNQNCVYVCVLFR